MGTNIQPTRGFQWSLGVQKTSRYRPKNDQWSTPEGEGTTHSNPLDQVPPRWALETKGGETKPQPLPGKADVWGKEGKRIGKGREDTCLGGGE